MKGHETEKKAHVKQHKIFKGAQNANNVFNLFKNLCEIQKASFGSSRIYLFFLFLALVQPCTAQATNDSYANVPPWFRFVILMLVSVFIATLGLIFYRHQCNKRRREIYELIGMGRPDGVRENPEDTVIREECQALWVAYLDWWCLYGCQPNLRHELNIPPPPAQCKYCALHVLH